MTFVKSHWQLMLITAIVFALWSTPVVFPLKMLVVFFHEISHGLAAIFTGGSIIEMALSPQQGGHAVTMGGNRFAITSAGYIGSLVFGVVLFTLALRTKADTWTMGILGAALVVITLLYIRAPFGLIFGLISGSAMLIMARFASHQINDLALRIIGLSSMIYVPYDIFSDTLARSHLQSDAWAMAQTFGGTTMMWGGLWLIISLVVIGFCLRYNLRGNSNLF
ncbi:M50 family metallopeptidase [Parasulfitobacter algicola]|uniref:M50 family metallopeptidase n=1 Tax=Parasulfitobacter algicola TaxID=2614809 RepID=A0ABX2IYC3_9RHOB|nr:M50 family metallopeptidase [Sulfitobacter algicola]NSX55468.1 M50 family metallopeptidase [Sulfitobacter algicola]